MISVSNALSQLHIEAQEDVHNMIAINFSYHLNTAHIYHNYMHLTYNMYRYNQNKPLQNPTKGDQQKPKKKNIPKINFTQDMDDICST